MIYFLLGGAYHCSNTGPLPSGAVQLARMPLEGEQWNVGTGAFVTNGQIVADRDVPAGHIASAHLVKQSQAAAVLSGFILTKGLLAEEAAMAGIPIATLAAQVAAKAAAFNALEITRRQRKLAARA